MPAPAMGQGIAMPSPSRNGSASATAVPGRVQIAREQHHLDHDRRDAGAGEQRRDGAHAEGHQKRAAAAVVHVEARREPREVDDEDVEHRQREHHEQHGDPEVEPRATH